MLKENVLSEGKGAAEATHGSMKVAVREYRSLPVPGVAGASMGTCFVRVTDLPTELDNYMEINPRVPSRTKKGVLQGPVVKGILETLREEPESMVLKNQGIYVLVESAKYLHNPDKVSSLRLKLTDKGRHGIINGGHTYAAIREALETASEEELKTLERAYVKLHIMQGIEAELVPEIAEGLNRSRQVDDPSLLNLQGDFDIIRKALRGHPAEKAVAYHQGDSGEVYISEVLVYLAMFNTDRFTELRHPGGLYNRQALGLRYFTDDLAESKKSLVARIQRLPQILELVDKVRLHIPAAARKAGFKYGMARAGGQHLGGKHSTGMRLPFLDLQSEYRVPNGWVYPIVAAFRANLVWNKDKTAVTWREDLDKMLIDLMPALVSVCVAEHKDSGGRPELVGKKEAAYAACFTKVELYLARKGLL